MTTGLSILALEQESKQAVIRLTLKDFLPQCICVVSVQYLCVAGIGPVIQEGLWEMDYPSRALASSVRSWAYIPMEAMSEVQSDDCLTELFGTSGWAINTSLRSRSGWAINTVLQSCSGWGINTVLQSCSGWGINTALQSCSGWAINTALQSCSGWAINTALQSCSGWAINTALQSCSGAFRYLEN